MAIFVTFGDKLGYASFTTQLSPGHGGKLPSKIKLLEGCPQRKDWHSKCNLDNAGRCKEM
jgi:hypothetical protein